MRKEEAQLPGHRQLLPQGTGWRPVLLCHPVPREADPAPASAQEQNNPPSCIIQLKYKIEHIVCALLNYLRNYYAGSYSTRQFRVKTKQIFPLKLCGEMLLPRLGYGVGKAADESKLRESNPLSIDCVSSPWMTDLQPFCPAFWPIFYYKFSLSNIKS